MRHVPELDERTTEDILCGRTAVLDGDDRVLAETMATLRSRVVTPLQPSEQLLRVFADGLAGQDPQPIREVGAPTGSPSSWRRRRTGRGRLGRIAGLGLIAKLVVVGSAAAAAAVGGAGAAGVLPGQAGDVPPSSPLEGPETAPADPFVPEPSQGGVGDRDPLDARPSHGVVSESVTTPDGATGSGGPQHRGGADAPAHARVGAAGDRGLSHAAERTDRSRGSPPRSGDHGPADAGRRGENPAAVSPPAGADVGQGQAGSAGGPPPAGGRAGERDPGGPVGRANHPLVP